MAGEDPGDGIGGIAFQGKPAIVQVKGVLVNAVSDYAAVSATEVAADQGQ
ncbi:MAG: hypothetical protein Q8O14_04375 [bacterium]|nr:hypothetical protein [bacterium]